MSDITNETSPGKGHNSSAADYAKNISDALRKDYAHEEKAVEDLIVEARALPKNIAVDDEKALGDTASVIKRMRETTARLEKFRVVEKDPHFRASQAVDSLFFGWSEKLERRTNKSNPGVADILQVRINDVNQRKADIERRRREEEARIAMEEARRLQAIEDANRKAAAEAAAAAERARKPENVQAHEEKAEHHAALANETQIDARLAAMKAGQAVAATAVKTSDLVRTRFDGGAMVTSRQVPVVEIVDRDRLDMAKLWPHLKDEHVLAALKEWAKTNGHKTPMAGALIEMRDEAVIR